ncbi:MAG: TadE/TadG family type IV pilus assembly protein [Sciscionella sp.]
MTTMRLTNALRLARSRLPARTAGDDGFSTLEAVVVIPVVVIITMLVIQYVMLWHARNLAEAAAQNGLRVARGYQATAAQGQASATHYLDSVASNLLQDRQVDAHRTATTVEVTVHASVLSVVPFGSYTVDETASGPVERYVDSPPG